jgi:hypothetical protein
MPVAVPFFEPLADLVHAGQAITSVTANRQVHVRPGQTQALHQMLQIVVGTRGRVHRPGPQRQDDGLIIVSTRDE